ncbi:MAG: DUF4249 family protein [Porphyromonadaceae bacterium]|nr:MAG: DUF4249 family protein [Porphyromonadaceae bacterium]
MKTINRSALILLGIVSFLISCEKDITIKQLPYTDKVSIECLLTPGATPVLYLYRTVPFFDPKITKRSLFIDQASVMIKSEHGTDILTPDSAIDPFYCDYKYFYHGGKIIEANVRYDLEVTINGEVFKASTTTDNQVVQLDSVHYVSNFKDIYGEHEGVVCNFKDDPNRVNFYRYEMTRMIDSTTYGVNKIKSPCLGNEKVMVREIGRSIYSDQHMNGVPMVFTVEPAFKHKAGDACYVYLQICDKNMFDYYDQLDKQKLAQMNPFVEPVFLRPTQFINAFGVFGSFVRSDSVLFIYPE